MKVSKFRKQIIFDLQDKAFKMYSTGKMTTRQIGEKIGKSYSWVSRAVKASEARQMTPKK